MLDLNPESIAVITDAVAQVFAATSAAMVVGLIVFITRVRK